MGVHKFIYGGNTLFDITDSTVTPQTLFFGAIAYDKSGNRIVGEYLPQSVTNQIPISIGTDGNIYNGVGYKNGYRLNSAGGEQADSYGGITGFIPIKKGDRVYLKDVAINTDANDSYSGVMWLDFYDTSFTFKIGFMPKFAYSYVISEITTDPNTGYITSFLYNDKYNNCPSGYMRVSAYQGIRNTSIITVNQEITW